MRYPALARISEIGVKSSANACIAAERIRSRVASMTEFGVTVSIGLADCVDVSQMGNVTLELVKRGYSEEEIRKIWGGNIMRVMREVQSKTEKL